jgi:RNA polymerase sigma factor (sigma-70 family)
MRSTRGSRTVWCAMTATAAGSLATQALDCLYRDHAREVYRYAYAVLGNRADAEDVTQTTFVNALGALERGERPRKPSNWLITIAHNVVRQRFRLSRARPEEVALDRDIAVVGQPDSDGPSLEELVRALQQIPSSQREALVLRELEGRPYKEIAEILGLTSGAVETLLFRARRSLVEELEHLVTCERAEIALSRRLDDRLSRLERRRLDQHLRQCASCKRAAATQTKHRRAFKGLAVLPVPLSLTLLRDPSSATAATLPTIGVTSTTGSSVVTGSNTSIAGGLLGGLTAKTAAVVATVTVAGSVGYTGVKHLERHEAHPAPARAAQAPAPTPRPTGAADTSERNEPPTTAQRIVSADTTRAERPTEPTRVANASANTASDQSRSTLVRSRSDAADKQFRNAARRAGVTRRRVTGRPNRAKTHIARSGTNAAALPTVLPGSGKATSSAAKRPDQQAGPRAYGKDGASATSVGPSDTASIEAASGSADQ